MKNIVLISVIVLTFRANAQDRFPRHSFSTSDRSLTGPAAGSHDEIARRYIREQAPAAGLTLLDLEGLYIVKDYMTDHNGVHHLVYQQQFSGITVWNSDFTVNLDSDGRIINSGGQIYNRPAGNVKVPAMDSAIPSLDRALQKLHFTGRAGKYTSARQTRDPILRTFRFVREGASGDAVDGDPMWYPVNGKLRPVWMFYIDDDNGVDRWATPVDTETGAVFAKQNLTWSQQARVFDKGSPQPNTAPGTVSPAVRPYVDRTMQPLTGDPKASPKGWVSGNMTAGNNVVAAPNPNGIRFDPTSVPIAGVNGVFDFPVLLGSGSPNPVAFTPAEVTNLFYWANLAHDSFYAAGFDEQAGAYQADNFGKGGVDGDPMYAFSQFGSQGSGSAALNNAFYTTTRANEDGSQGSINMYVGGSATYRLFTDGSYDAEVITHEYTHGVSTRLVRQLGTQQGGSMGEAWSDFYSLEFTLPMGAPSDGYYTEGDYLFQSFGVGIRTHPYTTDLKINPLTFAQFGSVSSYPEVHADGEIWVEALWDIRANLIEQFGEKEGRRRVRLIVLDGMKLSPPAPTMIDMRDAILLAERVDFNGASQTQIWKAFAKRGMGALAYSIDPNSTFIAPSFDMPSATGQMRFYQNELITLETVRLILQDSNLSASTVQVQLATTSGDLEDLLLRKVGSIYYGTMPSATASTRQRNNVLTAIPGDYITAYYTDADTGDGTPAQISASLGVRQDYSQLIYYGYPRYTFNPERPLFNFPTNDNAIRVELPFDFPFYGKKYRRAWISTDGIISFVTPEPFTSLCPSHKELAAAPAIAPAFTNLATGFDPKQDVFISTGIDFVTFHWVGLTQPYGYQVESSPVDFNATLFDNGQILFQYGSGNKVVLADRLISTAFACDAGAAVSGISPGHAETFQTAFYADGLTNLENAPTTMWIPPFNNSSVPQGILETPAEGATVKDVLTVSGVAYDTDGFPTVDILIDGMMRGTSFIGIPRQDLCSQQRLPNCPYIGFSTDINLTAIPLGPGSHSIQLRARNNHAGLTTFPDKPVSFTVSGALSRLPVGAIESPKDGSAVSGTVQVSGYAYAPDLRVNSVTLLVDGISYAPANLLITRSDICGTLTAPVPPNCPRIGFQFNLNTVSNGVWLPNGPHKMQLRVQDSLGRITVVPDQPVSFTVDNPDRAPSQGVLEMPKLGDTLSGLIDLSGYAYSPVAGRVTAVNVLVDGSSAGALTYGGARADACAALPDVAACPNIGFTGRLDTRRFTNGPHVLGIQIVNSTGSATTVPQLARYGMSVIIQN